MPQNRHSTGNFLVRCPGFQSLDWLPAFGDQSVLAKPWDAVGPNLSSTNLNFLHDSLGGEGDAERPLEGFVYMASYKSPWKFDVIPSEYWNTLESFQMELEKWYAGKAPNTPLWNTMGLWGPYHAGHPRYIREDLLVVVRHLGGFYRGCVLSVSGQSSYYVELLDYGKVVKVDGKDVFDMAQVFAAQPVYALRCSLNLPSRYFNLEGFLAAFDHIPESARDDIKAKLRNVALTTFSMAIWEKEVKVDYLWKNMLKEGQPWMVNLFAQVQDGHERVDLGKAIESAMDDTLKSVSWWAT